MILHSQSFMQISKGTLAAMAALTLASCASTRSSPEQLVASNPTVTYEYRNGDELIQANQQAISFCNQHQGLPRAQSFDSQGDRDHRVTFECVGASSFSSTPQRQSNSDLTCTFRTERELLDVSRDAQVYCMNSGTPEMDSNIVVHTKVSKTVTFRCSRG
jgi:hypothetical protein